MNLKKMAVVGFIIIIGGGVAFMTIKKDTGEKNTQKLQESILISEFLMERGEYVGKGVLSEYYIYTGKEKKIVDIPFSTLDINKNHTKVVGEVDERKNGAMEFWNITWRHIRRVTF